LKPGLTAVELEHCREVALKPGSLFEFTSRFLPAERPEEYLALYALVRTIQLIPTAHVDEEVIWAKLKWWSEELAAQPDAASRHPLLRALWSSGARKKIDTGMLQRLIQGSVSCIDVAPDSDESDMFERLAALGSTTIELELALDEAVIDKELARYLSAASGIFDVLAGFGNGGPPEYERIPLSVLAEFNLSMQQLERQPAELAQVITRLAGLGLDWYSQGMAGLGLAGLDSTNSNRAGKHLRLRWAMESRGLGKIKKNAAGFLETGIRYGPADAWFAWRFLRQLH